MSLPKKVKVGPWTYEIKLVDGWVGEHDLWGQISHGERVIRMSDQQGVADLQTHLLHEINHAIYLLFRLSSGGGEIDEERIVDAFANGWAMIYKDNPALLKFLGE